MAGITGQGTTFNLPNYVGELFAVTPSDTPFLASIGGLTGGEAVTHTQFEWQGYDLRAAGQNTRVEGANAPTAEERVRFSVNNVVQIHQEAVETSYTKNAATGQFAGLNNSQTGGLGSSEQDWQVTQMLKQIARDIEYSFIRGTYQLPADNTTARQTRGILAAITTNATVAPDDDGAGAGTTGALTEDLLLDTMQSVWENGGIQEDETRTLIVNAYQKRVLTDIFVTNKGYAEESRNVAGVSVKTIETDFGRVNVMLNRYMPTDQVAIVSLEECAPAFLYIPDKGFLFEEPLAKVGASERTQIYGEVGLRYGNERKHGKITNLTVV